MSDTGPDASATEAGPRGPDKTAIVECLRSVRSDTSTRRMSVVLIVGLLLVGSGSAAASWVITDGGDVTVEETTFETESDIELDATVYEPAEATTKRPRPGVLLIHGLGAERTTMESFATELSDRGYVAVTVDQPGHGTSDPPAFADGWGGPAALSYVRSMATVDEDRVALVGHSLGGAAALAAANASRDGYRSVVLVGSTYNLSGSPGANTTFPRNTAVIFGTYDEFSKLMWDRSVPGTVDRSEKLAHLFGTESRVEHGRIYGSVESGTARRFTAPRTTHGAVFYSPTAVADTIEWVKRTTETPGTEATETRSAADQHWHLAVLAQGVAFVGSLLLAVSTTILAWQLLGLARWNEPIDGGSDGRDQGSNERSLSRWTIVALTSITPVTLLAALIAGLFVIPTTPVTSQGTTNSYVLWGSSGLLLGAGFLRLRRGARLSVDRGSLLPKQKRLQRALVAGACGAVAAYLAAVFGSLIPGGELVAWVVSVQPLTPARAVAFGLYLLPLGASVVAFSIGLSRMLPESGSLGRDLRYGLGVTCGGLLVLLVVLQAPVFAGLGLPVPFLGPLAIPLQRALVLLAITTIIVVVTDRLTGTPLPGGFLAALLLTWWLVATATMNAAVGL